MLGQPEGGVCLLRSSCPDLPWRHCPAVKTRRVPHPGPCPGPEKHSEEEVQHSTGRLLAQVRMCVYWGGGGAVSLLQEAAISPQPRRHFPSTSPQSPLSLAAISPQPRRNLP